MTGTGPLSFDALINDVDFRSQLDVMERRVLGFSSTTVRETSKIDQSFKRLGQLAAGYFSFNALSQLPAQIIKVRGEFQQLEIAFTTMLKSKAKQEALMNELVQTAATTPFTLKDIASGAKQLLAYGSAVGQIVPEIRMLGDVAAGTSTPINELIYLYGTLRTQGRAYAVDIRQFAGRGIPIYEELAKVLGVNVDKVNDFVESGKVGFKQVEQAFKNMTSSGGLFAGLMDAQSKSLLGLKDRLSDAWELMLNDIGKKNEGVAAGLLNTATAVVQHYQDVIDVISILVGAYGGYRAALVLASVAQEAQSMAQIRNAAITEAQAIAQAEAASTSATLTLSQINAAKALAAATQAQAASATFAARAQATLNAVMNVNPIVLIGTAIATLATAYFVLRKNVEEMKTTQSLLSKATESSNSKFASQKAEVVSLISILKNQNVAESERLKAYDKLKEIAPTILKNLSFQKAKTADLTAATNDYIDSLKKRIRLEAGTDAFKDAFAQEYEKTQQVKKIQKELSDLNKEAEKQQKKARSVTPDGSGAARTVALSLDIQNKKVELAQALKDEKEARLITQQVEKSLGEGLSSGSKEALEAAIADDQIRLSQLDELSFGYKIAEENLKRHKAELDKLNKLPKSEKTFGEQLAEAESVGALRAVKAYADTDSKLEQLQKKVKDRLSNAVNGSKEKAQLDKLDADISYALGKRTKLQRDAEKVGPYGSISYWENVVKLAEEAISKTKTSDVTGIEKQKAIIVDAQKRIEEARKLTAIKSFEEELDEKQRLYEQYAKWVEQYGQASADKQFVQLKESGASYLDYLNTQIAKLETKQQAGPLSSTDSKNLSLLNSRKDDFTGKKSAIDQFTEGLQKAERESITLAEYLSKLKVIEDSLSQTSPVSPDYFKKKEALTTEVVKTQRQLQDNLMQFLTSSGGTSEQFLAIEKDFSERRAALDQKYNDKKSKAYLDALEVINNAEKRELQAFQQRKFEETKEYKDTTKVIIEEGEKRVAEQIRLQKIAVERAKVDYGINSEIYKQQKQALDDLTNQAGGSKLQKFISSYAGVVGQFGQALSQLGGTASVVGGILTGLATSMDLVLQSMEKGISKSKQTQIAVQAAANFAITLINAIASASAQRRQAEEQYEKQRLAAQQQYNQLLVEQLGLQSQKDESIFVKDYTGRINDSMQQLNAATEAYEKSIKKLNEGQAKLGQRNAIDWGAVGQSAVAGAAFGSVIPGVGTVVGAIAGTIVGGLTALFGAKKREDVFGSLLQEYPELVNTAGELNVALATTLISTDQVDEKTKLLLQDSIAWTEQIKKAKQAITDIVSELAGTLGSDIRNALVDAFEAGTDSAKAFGDAVGKVLENLLSNMIFSAVFGKKLKKLQDDMEAELEAGGTGENSIGAFFQSASKDIDTFNKAIEASQKRAEALGLKIFQSTNPQNQVNSLSGEIKGVSESTASVLAGQINSIRIGQAEATGIIRQQLLALNNIDRNTSRLERTNELLDSMDRRLKNIESDPLRAKGGG